MGKNEQNRFFDLCRCFVHINLVPRVFHLPTPNGEREEILCSGWSRVLLTNLSSCEGSHVASAVCYLQNRLSEQPWKAIFQFPSEALSCLVHSFAFSIAFERCEYQIITCDYLRHATYNLFSRSTFNYKKERTVLLFALPIAWVSVKFTDWVFYSKSPGRIKWSKEVTFVFPFRTDRKWINKTRRQKNMFTFVSVGLKVLR